MPNLSPINPQDTQAPELRAMYMSDLPQVLAIIEEHDDDDAESAEADYQEEGFDNQFVLEVDDAVVGVTGYREVSATDNTYWLSWTYLDESVRGRGLGKGMLAQVLQKLRDAEARKLFVKISGYEDPDEGKIYERAMKMYQSSGFETEVVSESFYDEGEDQFILGLNLQGEDADFSGDFPKVEEEKPMIRFNGLHEIADSDGAYTFDWVVQDSFKLFGKRSFSVDDLVLGLRSVKQAGGRRVFLTFPSNLPLIHKPLQAAGFKFVGQLTDYYERGVHEFHFTHDLADL
ncbi:MAG: GNAT superfamily N-acetyltransferase [Gammaproteobacteria bacterium]|jgi:GNAT superfamily N-acetyltransferase